MQSIKIKDLYEYKLLSEITCSPDGKYATFAINQCEEEGNKYIGSLALLEISTGNIKPLTANGDERSCMWLDNENIMFASKRQEADAKAVSYYKMSIFGGEAEHLFNISAKVASIKKLSDDKYFVTVVKPCEEPKTEDKNRAKEGKDYLIFDEIPFWANGQGIRSKIRNSGMIFTPSTGELTQFTEKYLNVNGAKISDDNSKILYWGATYTDMLDKFAGLYEYHIGSGATVTLIDDGKISINFAEYWGNKILVEGSAKDNNSSQNPLLYMVCPVSKSCELFADLDAGLGNASGCDVAYGGGRTSKVVGNKFYCLHTQWGNSYLSYIDEDGKINHVNEVIGAISSFDIVNDVAYCVALRDYNPQELYSICLTSGKETKITKLNEDFVATHTIVKPEYFTFVAKDGHTLEGWVIKPAQYVEGNKYPAILTVHGGPKAAFGANYFHEMQCMVNMNMFVFYTNPRGSDGRGEEFSRLVGKLGEIDFDDLMEFTDEVVKRYADIDEDKLGICGGSYGGFICNWAIGHTNRFKAAASQRSISNYFSKCLTTDIGYYHNLSQVGASPWDNSDKMWYHSPLKYVTNAVTPTLFIQSDEDYRCWMSEPLQMFTNLRERNIPSKVVLYHGENHELSRAGKPKNRISRLSEICGWFETYLK